MTTAQKQFIELLKAGLWGTPADPKLFQPENTDWKEILRISTEQTVTVIITDGISTLPNELWPQKKVMIQLMMLRMKTEQTHTLLNKTVNQIVNALNKENIPSVLLKGQGVAQNYNTPTSRTCGDIDLYTGLDGYKKAGEITEELRKNQNCSQAIECDHHLHLTLNGVEIEIHRQASFVPGKKANNILNDWTKESIDRNFGTDRLDIWNNDGTSIALAPPTYNSFFILHHAVRHMTTEGVGIRQICDWAMLLHKNHSRINCAELEQKLREMHLLQVWKEFGRLAVTVLGLPENELPLAPADVNKPNRKTDKILQHIFISGNFGRHDANGKSRTQTTYYKRKWRSFKYQSLRLLKLLNLFPEYAANYMWNWLGEAFKKVITGSDK